MKTPAPNLQRYTGKYRNAWSDYEVAIVNGELAGFDPGAIDPVLPEQSRRRG